MIKTLDADFVLPRDTIQTHLGYYDYLKNDPNLINVEDIAHSLAMVCRYNAHCDFFYSVAAHSCFVHDMMEADGWYDISLHGLIHDGHEAYVQDMTRPLKRLLLEQYGFDFNKVVSDPIDKAIYTKFGLQFPISPSIHKAVKHFDNIALVTEKEHLFGKKLNWGWEYEARSKAEFEPYMDVTRNWKQEFLIRFEQYNVAV